MEQLGTERTRGFSSGALRAWGMVFLIMGVIGRSILQNRLLGLGNVTTTELLALMDQRPELMTYATVALLLQALETCALPVFTVLLLDGFLHTSNYRNYLLRVAGLALVCEIPFDLAMSGKVLDLSVQNPVLGMALGLVLLYFYRRYDERSGRNILIKLLVAVAAILWAEMLRIEHGAAVVLVLCVLWIFRRKLLLRNIAGASAVVLCTLISPFYMAAPMAFLLVHFHNGERGAENKVVNYAIYPAALLIIGLVAKFAF